MPTIYDLKPAFQSLLRPFVRRLVGIGVNANQVTVFAVVLSGATGLTVYLYPGNTWPLLLIPIVLFIRMALNAMDGMMAREFGMTTRLGAILNELGDVLSDTLLYLPLALVPAFDAPLVVLFVILSIISEMTGVIAVQIGASRRYDGPMGKSDRAFVIGLLALLIASGVTPGAWVEWYLAFVVLLLCITVINRGRLALKEVSK